MSVLREAAMADDASRSRLGRGLASLIGDMGAECAAATDPLERARGQRRVPIEHIRANPNNPRKHFSDAELDDLANSIRERGIIQPIVVRAVAAATISRSSPANGAGAPRNARRCTMCRSSSSKPRDSEALAACDHRERAACRSQCAGRSRGLSVAGRSVQLFAGRHRAARRQKPQPCREHGAADEIVAAGADLVNAGKLSAGHARMLIGQPNAEELAQDIVARGLNVRQVEELARGNAERIDQQAANVATQGPRYACAGKACVGCPRPGGQRGSSWRCRAARCISNTAISISSMKS